MSELSITDVDVSILEGPRPWAIVRVETDAGVSGIGEIPRMNHGAREIERYGRTLIGEDPFDTEALFGATSEFGSGGGLDATANDIYVTTMAGGFDMACWDVKGKHLGVPVYELLGGKLRDRVRAYANGWDFAAREIVDRYHDGEDPESVLPDVKAEITESGAAVVDAGYDAMKFSPFQWGQGPTTSQRELDYTMAVIEAVAETVGPDVELLIEGHKHLSTEKAITAARRLERFDPTWYEEPVPADVGPLRRVARHSPVPIATGESFVTHHGFAELVSNTDVSVVQPDVGRAGGITELRKIAAMASAERVGFAPHNAAGPVMTAAAVQVDAAASAFMIQESFEAFFHPDWATELFENPLEIDDGYIEIPDRPGLGLTVDEAVFEARDVTDEFR